MIIIGGIYWISAAGDQGRIKNAKKYIVNAFIGLGLALFSYIFLALIGITALNMPGIQKIEPMPLPVFDNEFNQQDTFNQTPSPGAAPTAGTIPRIFQCDYRDIRFNCSSKSVCSSGCGTVSVTMILRYYGINISIPQAVQFMASGGYIGCNVSGTSPSGFTAIAKANGLTSHTVSIDFNTIKNLVAEGKPIIANVGNPVSGGTRTCKYTAHGHYIVLSGWDAPNNRFIINDPGGRATNRYNGTWDDLTKGCIFKGAYYVGH
jgi:predicted double-glycine peptidase